jgi:RNA polymerase sigma-70 factor (ECF subfamily)
MMEARQSHIGIGQNPAVQLRSRYSGELQDVVTRSLPMLYRRAYRYVSDPHDAEDAVQDALLSAYRHLDQFKGTAKLSTWLTTIVTNSALTQLRKRSRHVFVSLDERVGEDQDFCVADLLADEEPSPEGEYIESQRHQHLMRHVRKLSPLLRRTIQLCDLDGLTTKEVAVILDVPHSTVKARVARGREKLRHMMCKMQQRG